MNKHIFTFLFCALSSIAASAATTNTLHNQDFENYQKETKLALPSNMRDCPITGIKNQSMDARAIIDFSSYAVVSMGAKTVSTFYMYHSDTSNEAIPRDELTKLIVTETHAGIEKAQVEIYKLEEKTLEKDIRTGKIDFPGYVLKYVYPCNKGQF